MAKALVLKDADTTLAIVSMDLVGVPPANVAAIKEALAERAGIDVAMLLVSHTHSGPDGDPSFPSAENPWVKELEEKVIAAVVAAKDALVPVRYGAGNGEVVEGHNRRKVAEDGSVEMFWRNTERVPTSPVDYNVGVIRFEKMDGSVLASVVNFTCHPVVLGPENLEISADYVGVMAKAFEAEVGGVCLFAQGASGDINPFWGKTPPAEGAFEAMENMGKAVAAEAIRVSKSVKVGEGSDAALTAVSDSVRIEPRWDLNDPEVIGALEAKYGKVLVAMYLNRLKDKMGDEWLAEVVTVTLGDDVAFAGFPGEFFVEHGLDLKARSAIPNTYFFGYCNKTYAYFPTINAAWQGGYGAKEASIVEVGAGERLVNKALANLYYQTGRLSRIPSF